MGQLNGHIAIVTGTGDGIGAEIARRYAKEGARVVLAELNPETGKALADELGESGFFVPTDASKREDVEAMVKATVDQFGTLDILVNNAWGGGRLGRIEKKTENEMAKALLAGGFIGVFMEQESGLAAEEGGCQYECGFASGIAAAELVEVMGGDGEMATDGVSSAMQNTRGVVGCPVPGRVAVPCRGIDHMVA